MKPASAATGIRAARSIGKSIQTRRAPSLRQCWSEAPSDARNSSGSLGSVSVSTRMPPNWSGEKGRMSESTTRSGYAGRRRWHEVEDDRHDRVQRQQQEPFEPVRLAVQAQEAHAEHGEEDRAQLEVVEDQRHR